MGRKARLGWTAAVSSTLAVGLWLGLQYGAGYAPDVASAVGVGMAALLGGMGTAWSQLPDDPGGDLAVVSASGTGTLKGVTSTFADRIDEWADIQTLARRAWHGDKIRLALLIYGMPGVGKSEFAQYAAHRLVAEFSRYARRRHLELLPRQVELHGLEGVGRTDPRDALRAQLDLGGPDPRRATMNLDELAAEWRKYLQGKFLVLVLDNADDEGQVQPFLPGGSSYIVLVTGRRTLQGLIASGVTPYHLGVLGGQGAAQMMENIVARSLAAGEQEAVEEIAQLCGHQPLAIKLAVQPLAGRPGVSLTSRQAQLVGHPNRLLAIDEYARRGSEGSGGVANAFDLSYTHLTDSAKLVLRRQALAPVPTLGVAAVAVLADLSSDEAAASLRDLAEESLIAEDEAAEHFRMHDLIRHYARSLAERNSPAESKAAVNRLLAYYCDAAAQADALLTRQPAPAAIEWPAPTVREEFTGRSSVISWSRAELPSLLACADYAVRRAANGQLEDNAWVVVCASVLAGILRNEGRWRRSIELQTQALKSADAMGVPLAAANALSERGMLYRLTAELVSAAADLEHAVGIYRQVGGAAGRTGEAHARNTYGVVLDQLGRPDEAQRQLSEALNIYQQVGDPLGVANVLHDQGMAEFFTKNYDGAIGLLGQALDLYRTVDQPLGMAHAHNNLARAQQRVGMEENAADNLESAKVLYQDLGNRLGEINALIRLGAVLRHRDHGRAVTVLADAIRLSIDIDNQLARIDALDELGEVHMAVGDRKAALDAWSRALRLAREHAVGREEAKLAGKVGSANHPTVGMLPVYSRFGQPLEEGIGFVRRWKR